MYLQMICAELTRENLMLFPHVLLKLLKLGEDFRLWTATAYRCQKIPGDTHDIHFYLAAVQEPALPHISAHSTHM